MGWYTTMSNNADFYALVQYVQAEVSVSGFGYVDLGDAGDGTSFGAHLLYNFTPNFAAGLFLDIEDDVTGYGAGVRFYW